MGQLHKFISPLDDEALVHISRLVLRRPADCLTKLKRHLKERMITQDNDTTPRVWNPASSTGLGLLYCASEGAVNLQYTASNPSGMPHTHCPASLLQGLSATCQTMMPGLTMS